MRTSKPSLTRKQINSPKISIKTLQKALEVEAKKANTRLRALEKTGISKQSKAYKAIRDYAEDNRQFIRSDKTGNVRFNRSIKGRTREELQEELNQLQAFLYESKTSTATGIKQTKKRVKEATAKQNTTGTKSQAVQDFFNNMSEEDFDRFWELNNIKRLYDMYGSDETVRIIESVKSNKYIGEDMELLDQALGDILTDYNKSLSSVYADLESYKPTGIIE